MAQYRYRLETLRDSETQSLVSDRAYYESECYSEKLMKFIDAGYTFVIKAEVSVSESWYETIIATDKKLTEDELKNFVEHYNTNTVCTDCFV